MSDFIRHSIHCHGYRGCDVDFDDDACTCGATLKHCQAEIDRLHTIIAAYATIEAARRVGKHPPERCLDYVRDYHESLRAAGGDDE